MLQKNNPGANFGGKLLLFLLLIFSASRTHAQCAGENATLSVCDYANPANQSINLFNLLGGSPSVGGVWSDPVQTGALNATTGILNVWNIHLSGMYTFTYTVNGVNGCADNTATITLTLGGYSGIPSPNGSACNDDESVNLFQFFIGIPPNPHLNGTWHDDDNSGGLVNNILDATVPALGAYHFTYTMPAVGNCPAVSSTILVTIFRAPIPGIPARLTYCSDADFSELTNVNLFDLLAGEDPNGQWSESGTNELSSPFDPFIDIQNIFTTFGVGTYNFTYTVYPENPVCDIKSATVRITFEDPLDFTGAVFTVNSDICENAIPTATYTATLTQGTIVNPIGPYQITYTVTGTATTTVTTGNLNFVGGIITIPLQAALFQQVGTYTITIVGIRYMNNEGVCENIIDASDELHISPIPKINAATLTILPVCQGSDVVVELSGTNNLGTGNYEITYDLTGSNTATGQMITINSVAGAASFTIPASLVPNAGNTILKITHIENLDTGCANASTLAKTFVIHPVLNLTVVPVIADVCQNQPVSVTLTGLGNLTSIAIVYSLSGANPVTNQMLTLPVTSGSATFIIPEMVVPNLGTSTFTINSIMNNSTTCPVTLTTQTDAFSINETPDTPTVSNAAFCSADNATIADLVPNGAGFSWFDSPTATSPLAATTVLLSGNYYVSESNGTTGCDSDRAMAVVTVTAVPNPVLNPDGASFCGLDNPTLLDLANHTNAGNGIIWFDAPNGNALADSDLLQQGITYYGYGISDTTDCISEGVLAVTVTLTDCEPTEYDFFIPDGFSPNGDSVNDVFQIPDIQFLFPDYTLEIYNRYGELMFKGHINSPAWNGKNSQSNSSIDGIAPNGVYYYIVNFNRNNAKPRQGFLYLNR